MCAKMNNLNCAIETTDMTNDQMMIDNDKKQIQ